MPMRATFRNAPAPGGPSRLMPLAVVGSALLAVASGVLFYYASRTAIRSPAGPVYRVTVREKSCDPNSLVAPAGRVAFEIYNASNRTLEWEILDGVMVVEERENIAPGFRSALTARLRPGRYEITCGLLSNPRGSLVVEASAESEAERQKPPLKAFIGPLAEYRVYLVQQSSTLIKEAARLAAAIRAGDIDEARLRYVATRLPYRRMDIVAGRFSDLKNRIDPVADYLEKREDDPAFSGFHRIERALFAKRSLDGLQPVADALAADVAALGARIRALRLSPGDICSSVERQARLFAESQIVKGESPYARNELVEFEASLQGMGKALDLLSPVLQGLAAPALALVQERRSVAASGLESLKRAGGYPAYDEVGSPTRDKLAGDFRAFAEAVAKLGVLLGPE